MSPSLSATPPLAGITIAINPSGGATKIFTGGGDPNSSATDSSAGDLAGAGIGSIYLRMDAPDSTHGLYVKTAAASPSAATGTWTGK
jgi:hypothetical protein